MSNDLLQQFFEGQAAFLAKSKDCPYLATSDSADAWHAGYFHESLGTGPFTVLRVWHGRGYRVNVEESAWSRKCKLVYAIDWADLWPVVSLLD